MCMVGPGGLGARVGVRHGCGVVIFAECGEGGCQPVLWGEG